MKILFSPKTFEKLRDVIGPLLAGHEMEVADEADLEDRRVKRVLLTPKGKKAVSTMDVVRPIIDDIVMRGLSPLARMKLTEGMLQMRSNLLQMQRTSGPQLAKRLQSLGQELEQ